MVIFSTTSFDLDGFVLLPKTNKSALAGTVRRLNRAKTLDGGVAISDLGFSDGDRTLRIVAEKVTKTLADKIAYLQKTYPIMMLSTDTGLFLGALAEISISRGTLQIIFLVEEKLAEG